MENIIFNKAAYEEVDPRVKSLYRCLGGNVYALDPKHMRIEAHKLPKWLSLEQYTFYRRSIGSYYSLTTRGFGSEVLPLMQLHFNTACGIRSNYSTVAVPKMTRITEREYWCLSPAQKVKYKRILVNGTTYYANTHIPAKMVKTVAKSVLRQPTIGKGKVPSGSWLEVP